MSILTQGGAAGGGSTTDLASPGAIGGTTPAAISCTTLTATGLIKGKDGTAAAPSISGTTTTNSGFYFSGASPAWTISGVLQGYWDAGHQYMYKGGTVTAYGATDGAVNCSVGPGPIANSICFGPSTTGSGAATTRVEVNKAVASIADNTATATFTVTVPNGAHSAAFKVTLVGSLGAGGAIGANEASASIAYDIGIARTAGVNAVATISSAYGSSGSTAVAGAATCTVTAALSAISGAVGATNTFTVNVTIARGSGSSANHTCLCYGVLLNANASGVTIA